MIKSNFICTEYRGSQTISLTGITSLAVTNTGDCMVNINGKNIYEGQKEIFVVPDGTFSDVNLVVEFISNGKKNSRQTIFLVYKKIS